MASVTAFPSPSSAPPSPVTAHGRHDARFRVANVLARKLPTHLKGLYLHIVDDMFPDDTRGSSTWKALPTIARDAQSARRTTRRGVDALVRAGFLRRDYGAVWRGGVLKRGLGRTAVLAFVWNPEQERAQRDARHAERRAQADTNRAARQAEFNALHERRVRLQVAVETGKVRLGDAAPQWDALKADERALLRACGYTWNLNTAKAEQRKATKRPTPTLGGKPRADAQFVRPATVQQFAAQLAAQRSMDAAPTPDTPTPAPGGRKERPQFKAQVSRWWLHAEPPAQCACGAVVVRNPHTGRLFDYDAPNGTANPNAPHVCP